MSGSYSRLSEVCCWLYGARLGCGLGWVYGQLLAHMLRHCRRHYTCCEYDWHCWPAAVCQAQAPGGCRTGPIKLQDWKATDWTVWHHRVHGRSQGGGILGVLGPQSNPTKIIKDKTCTHCALGWYNWTISTKSYIGPPIKNSGYAHRRVHGWGVGIAT